MLTNGFHSVTPRQSEEIGQPDACNVSIFRSAASVLVGPAAASRWVRGGPVGRGRIAVARRGASRSAAAGIGRGTDLSGAVETAWTGRASVQLPRIALRRFTSSAPLATISGATLMPALARAASRMTSPSI